MVISKQQILTWLEDVKDPEIPVLSLVDLGVITDVTVDKNHVRVEMTPTFVGCPAMDYMKMEVENLLKEKGVIPDVQISFKKPWSSDLISEKGKVALKKYGLAPPPSNKIFTDLEILETAICPRCDGSNTELKSPFGPTLCRALYYCHDCKEAFEQFKPL
ncbi:MAG TPA: phenylacetate-CoA oxygenase subunit PaaJ [Cyclobacteriaceae bacterium]|nr:phenylacetate-CoA oxygenase subunit PaaJ [Cyclobacteriaceae bacterium]HPW60655.1 phenylacetate-CoA oxygenase subunit PaaJ [Cyclobacteriaceae bacterium]HRG78758.1 phenylacetate-CoA oxygenase subunit PaaJ [Cyclobacteriaceae bacterium]